MNKALLPGILLLIIPFMATAQFGCPDPLNDDIPPVATCVADLSVRIGPSGYTCISVVDIDNGSFDNCNVASMTLDKYCFTCAVAGGQIEEVTLTVSDGTNTSECTTLVEVTASLPAPPLQLNCPSTTIDLGIGEEVTVDAADLADSGFFASGGCGGTTLSISPSVFQIGVTPAEIVATDGVGHTSSPCSVTVTVRAPCSEIPTNLSVSNPNLNEVTFRWDDVGANSCIVFVRRRFGRPQTSAQRLGARLLTTPFGSSLTVDNTWFIPNGLYRFRVKCFCDDTETTWSNFYGFRYTTDIGDLSAAYKAPVPSGLATLMPHNYVIYPNPVKDKLKIRYEGEDLGPQLLRLIDLTGRTVQAQEVEAGQWEVQLSVKGLPAGLYILNAESNLGKRQFKVIVGADSGVRDD